MKTRTLCACQPQADMISAKVAPLARPIISRIFAPLPWLFGAFLLFAVFFSLAAPALGLAALPLFRRAARAGSARESTPLRRLPRRATVDGASCRRSSG